MLVGVDAGPAHISAALMDGPDVRAAVSQPAGPSLTGGVLSALRQLVQQAPEASSARSVTVSTAKFETAASAVEGLARTGCVRLCAAEAENLPPMAGWPMVMRDALGDNLFLCQGGHDFDGTPLAPLDEEELDRVAAIVAKRRLGAVAITSVFAPVNPEAELAAASILRERLPGVRIALSHEIGTIGLLERENATIINAALLPLADEVATALAHETQATIPDARIYLAHNDGTVMELSFGRRYPVFTFWSGLASAMRGAALLNGTENCVAIDIGTHTTDIGVVSGALPRQVRQDVSVAGIRTNLRRPETVTIPVGSASLPDVGRPGDRGQFRRSRAAMVSQLEQGIHAVAPGGALPVVLVGQGAPALPKELETRRPRHGEVARAVGAASSRIGGEVDRIISGDPTTRSRSIENAKSLAVQKAVMAGAADQTIHITEVEEIPLAYLPGDFVRVRVKAIGDLR